jgi:hypothetical protein
MGGGCRPGGLGFEQLFDQREGRMFVPSADYGDTVPVRPGAVDAVRAAALVEAIEAGVLVWDPAEEALFGPDPDVDVAALFAALDAEAATEAGDGGDGVAVGGAADPPTVSTGVAGGSGRSAGVGAAADAECAGDGSGTGTGQAAGRRGYHRVGGV